MRFPHQKHPEDRQKVYAWLQRGLVCLCMILCLGFGAEASAQWVRSRRVDGGALQSRKFALLIGISRFSNKRWAPLSYAENDVHKMASMLREMGVRRYALQEARMLDRTPCLGGEALDDAAFMSETAAMFEEFEVRYAS